LAFASTGDERLNAVGKAILLSGGGICLEGALDVNSAKARTSNHSSWTYKGAELPFVEIGTIQPFLHDGKLAFVDMYTKALDRAEHLKQLDKAIFDISSLAHAQILFIGGVQDKVGPVVRSVDLLLKKNRMPKNVEFLKLENAGHMVTFAYSDKQGWFKFGTIPLLLGDTTQEAAQKAKLKIGEYLLRRNYFNIAQELLKQFLKRFYLSHRLSFRA
jgi:pimeloyl-ACP methyl ester carboxylesterase